MPGSRRREMRADHQHRLAGNTLHHGAAHPRTRQRIAVEGRRPLGMPELAGVVQHVAGDHGALALGLDQHAHVARGVAGGGHQGNLRRDAVVHLDQHGQPAVKNGLYRIGEDFLLFGIAFGAPVLVLAATDQVTRIREGGYPLAIDQPGVPAHVVHVQVRAHHGIHRFGRASCLRKAFEERCLQRHAAHQGTRLVVAHAGVYHQCQPGRAHHQRMNREFEVPFLGHEVRVQPGHLPQALRRCPGQEWMRGIIGDGHFEFDDPCDRHVTDVPLQHGLTLPLVDRIVQPLARSHGGEYGSLEGPCSHAAATKNRPERCRSPRARSTQLRPAAGTRRGLASPATLASPRVRHMPPWHRLETGRELLYPAPSTFGRSTR